MTTRRVDKTDPRLASNVRPLTMPVSWVTEDNSVYETSLSGLTYVGAH